MDLTAQCESTFKERQPTGCAMGPSKLSDNRSVHRGCSQLSGSLFGGEHLVSEWLPGLRRAATHPHHSTVQKRCWRSSADRARVLAYQWITAVQRQPICALSFPTDVWLVLFRDIKPPPSPQFANMAQKRERIDWRRKRQSFLIGAELRCIMFDCLRGKKLFSHLVRHYFAKMS